MVKMTKSGQLFPPAKISLEDALFQCLKWPAFATALFGSGPWLLKLRYPDMEAAPLAEASSLLSFCLSVSLIWLAMAAVGLASIAFLSKNAVEHRANLTTNFQLAWSLSALLSIINSTLQLCLIFAGSLFISGMITPYLAEILAVPAIPFLALIGVLPFLLGKAALRNPEIAITVSHTQTVTQTDFPELWSIVEAAARHLKVAPPQNILIGLEPESYLTDLPIHHKTVTTTGRTLILAYPLLMNLSTEEATSIIAQALVLNPKDELPIARILAKKDSLLKGIRKVPYLPPSSSEILAYFGSTFQIALAEASGHRSLQADLDTTNLSSPRTLASALIKSYAISKIIASNNAANRVEREAFLKIRSNPYLTKDFIPNRLFYTGLLNKAPGHHHRALPTLRERLEGLEEQSDEVSIRKVFARHVDPASLEWFPKEMFSELIYEGALFALNEFSHEDFQSYNPIDPADRASLKTLFPRVKFVSSEKKFSRIQIPFIAVAVLSGCIGFLAWDQFPLAIVISLISGLYAVVHAVRYNGGTLAISFAGIIHSGWRRPLRFSEIADIFIVGERRRMPTLRIELKEPKLPPWSFRIYSFKSRSVSIPLYYFNEQYWLIYDTAVRYRRRKLLPADARRYSEANFK